MRNFSAQRSVRLCVIIGATGGIGALTARSFAAHGYNLLLAARHPDGLRQLADALSSTGTRVDWQCCDLTDDGSVAALATAADELGTVDVLVNCAGVVEVAPLRLASLESWNRMLAVNATGAFLCTRAFADGMVQRGHGRIVHVASRAGQVGAPYLAAYSASKQAVVGLVRAVDAELHGTGVSVSAVCAGPVDTAMMAAVVRCIADGTGLDQQQVRACYTGDGAGLMDPRQVAQAIVALCQGVADRDNGPIVALDSGSPLADCCG